MRSVFADAWDQPASQLDHDLVRSEDLPFRATEKGLVLVTYYILQKTSQRGVSRPTRMEESDNAVPLRGVFEERENKVENRPRTFACEAWGSGTAVGDIPPEICWSLRC